MTFPRSDRLHRRDFLNAGAISFLGLGLHELLARRVDASDIRPRAKSCIMIWLDGGPSHLDLWDMKPDAPQEVRGPFNAIESSIAGIRICEHLRQTARIFDRFAIIRSVTSPLGEHNLGAHYLLTGYKPSPVLNYPTFGSVLIHLSNPTRLLPNFIAIPDHRVGGNKALAQGFLPSATAPFEVGVAEGNSFVVPHLKYYPGLNADRIRNRQRFLTALDNFHRERARAGDAKPDPVFEQAVRLVTSQDTHEAFDLSHEPQATIDAYGGKPIGKYCLLARRLVERGVPFVTINHTGWDTHQQLSLALRDGFAGAKMPVGLVPSLDQAFSTLLMDLEQRGLLDETLVVVMGEFGRTPKINTAGGRDHWPRVFSVVLAGARIPGGQVIGASDATGESPRDRPITPADLACSIYQLLGIDPAQKIYTGDGRPVSVTQEGSWISELG